MNVQFNQWQLINLQDFGSSIRSVQGGVADTDAKLSGLATTPIIFFDGSSSTANGNWGPNDLFAKGSGFLGGAPLATFVQLTSIFDNTIYKLNGAVNVVNQGNSVYAITGGSFSAINHVENGVIDYSIKGSFQYTAFGELGGGTITSATINNQYGKLTLTGALTIDANEVIVGGTINAFTYTSVDGSQSFSISNASISYSALHDLIDAQSASTDFSAISNYFLDANQLTGNDLVTGDAESNTLNGYLGNDTLNGGLGNDTLDGGLGIDKMYGGMGNDTYKVDLVQIGTTVANYKVVLQDTITEAANAGNDSLELRGNFHHLNATTLTLASTLENLDASQTGTTKLNLTGNALNNILIGNDANNILFGGAGIDQIKGGLGDDTLDGGTGADDLIGGLGNDTYVIDNIGDTIIEDSGDSSDTVKYNIATAVAQTLTAGSGLFTNIENITVQGTGLYSLVGDTNNNILIGNAASNIIDSGNGNDTLVGSAGNDKLIGGLGDDSLDGGLGNDNMEGGDGNDTYLVNSLLDKVSELEDEGTDTIQSTVSYNLMDTDGAGINGGNIENLTLIGTAAINGTGNDLANTLAGNAAANILDGGIGADTMDGGKGNDTYIVDNTGDTVTEQLSAVQGGGTDLVKASVDFTLGLNLENLTLTGTDNITGKGNSLNNTIIGNSGNNSLDGSEGVDKLQGGLGNDIYTVDLVQTGTTAATFRVALQDNITEAVNAGNDSLVLRGSFTHINATTLTLAGTLENLDASQAGTTKLNLTGNALNNILTGNDSNNILNGGAGNDTLKGGLGNDKLIGGTGHDVFVFDSVGINNYDLISDFVSGQDKIDLSGSIFSSLFTDGIQTDMFVTGTGGADANDFIIYDKTTGELFFDADGNGSKAQELIVKLAPNTNLLQSDFIGAMPSISLLLEGTSSEDTINGGYGNDTLIGGAGYDVLNGGAGDDSLEGGMGGDTLAGGLGNDIINGGDGYSEYDFADYLTSLAGVTVNLSLLNAQNTVGAGIDTLTNIEGINGSNFNDSLTGNDGDNIVYGFDGNDTILGGLGSDVIDGGLGNDALNGGSGSNTVAYYTATSGVTVNLLIQTAQNTIGAGIDTIVNFQAIAGSNFADNLTCSNLGDSILGRGGNDTILGGSGNDYLSGNDGNDNINGANGSDTINGSFGNDTIDGGDGNDTIMGGEAGDTGEDNDLLIGGAGDDVILGYSGNDTIIGGAGLNELNGGPGADTFVFNVIKAEYDFIGDYNFSNDLTKDIIDLSGIDANSTLAGNQAFNFMGNDVAFTHVAGELIFNSGSNYVYGDVDGDAIADLKISMNYFTTSLSSEDFIL
jgi:serralysin